MRRLIVGALGALCLLSIGVRAVAQSGQAASDQTPSDQALGEVEHFTGGDAGHGRQLFERYCRGCHGPDGRGAGMTFMPHIGNLTKKDYIEFLPDGFLYTVITEGGAAVGKSGFMPSWKSTLSDQDIKDVIAFIRTLPTY
jgi:mono/diheme cytochrome c family protein